MQIEAWYTPPPRGTTVWTAQPSAESSYAESQPAGTVPSSHAISRLGTTAVLNQNRTAIYHNGLPSAESFLHQKQVGLSYVMSLADSPNRETLSHAFV
jgi:hypothetical protein